MMFGTFVSEHREGGELVVAHTARAIGGLPRGVNGGNQHRQPRQANDDHDHRTHQAAGMAFRFFFGRGRHGVILQFSPSIG